MTKSIRTQKLERAFHHWVYRNHPYMPMCDGCVEAASFLTMPGYAGSDKPLVY
jgi:hypothetical protein